MKKRIIVLFILLLFRFVLGYVEIIKYRTGTELGVTGNIDKVYQSESFCSLHIGRYIFRMEGICAVYKGNKIKAVGTVSGGLIEKFTGRISLVDAKIYKLDKYGESPKTCGLICDPTLNFRNILLNSIRRNVPEPEAGLVAGIVLGYKNDIGQKLYQEMVNSGTIHIAVASGYNVMLVGGTVLSLSFWIFKRKKATILAILIMIFYSVLAGGDPPVIRAVWMAGLLYVSAALGRSGSSLWTLCIALGVMVLWDTYIVTDISFQLSAAASLGIIVVDPWMKKLLAKKIGEKALEFLSGIGLVTSLSTLMTTAPVIAWHFGRVSWISIVSNTLILPVVPLLMILSSFLLVFGSILTTPVYAVAHYIILVIKFLGS